MKRSEILLMFFQLPLDFLLLVAAGQTAYYLRFTHWAVALRPVSFSITWPDFAQITVLAALGWIIIFAIVGLYSTDPNRKLWPDLVRVVLACSAGLSAIAVYVLFRQSPFDSRFLVAVGWVLSILYVSAGRIVMRGIKAVMYRAGQGLHRMIIIGEPEESLLATLHDRRELGYEVVGVFPHFTADVARIVAATKPDELLIMNPRVHEKETLQALDFCTEHNVVFKYSADLFSTYASNMVVNPLAGIPIVELKGTPLDGWGRVAKRLTDIVVSFLLIIIFAPLMLVIALLVWIETGRPIIYKNERVCIRGRKFFTLKFRSMYQKDSTGSQFGEAGKKAEAREQELIKQRNSKVGPIYKIANDPRVTPFGRFIRRWSLDELPQFFNVLGGSMSLVGPRPHQPREVEKYPSEHKRVLIIKPGITGLAQISGRSDLSFEDEIRLDVFYIERWSLMLDVIILLKTPFVIFKKRRVL